MNPDSKPTVEDIYLEYLEEYNSLVEQMENYFHKNNREIWFSKNFIDRFSPQISNNTKRISDRALLSEIHYKVTTQKEFNVFKMNVLKLATDLSAKSFQLAKGEL